MSFVVQLGKDVTITGVANGRTATFTNTASEIDVTKFGDTARKFRKALIEQTVEVECVDDPGVVAGGTFTISGSNTGDYTFVCTSVAEADPLDGIQTITVSGVRTNSA
jgi:Tfp pilus assembly protein PilW